MYWLDFLSSSLRTAIRSTTVLHFFVHERHSAGDAHTLLCHAREPGKTQKTELCTTAESERKRSRVFFTVSYDTSKQASRRLPSFFRLVFPTYSAFSPTDVVAMIHAAYHGGWRAALVFVHTSRRRRPFSSAPYSYGGGGR